MLRSEVARARRGAELDSAIAAARATLTTLSGPGVALDGFEGDLGTVEDIEGGPVRFLGERAADAGSHQWVWDGKNDEGTLVPSGVYYARLVLMDEDSGEVQVDFRREMLLAAFFADQVLIGTTDADGRLVIEDRKLFPYLYDLPLFPAMEETGAHMGIIEFTPTMRFYFTDPGSGTTLRFDGDVAGTTTLKFVWDPEEAPRPQ